MLLLLLEYLIIRRTYLKLEGLQYQSDLSPLWKNEAITVRLGDILI